jgi:hypothetical protein
MRVVLAPMDRPHSATRNIPDLEKSAMQEVCPEFGSVDTGKASVDTGLMADAACKTGGRCEVPAMEGKSEELVCVHLS